MMSKVLYFRREDGVVGVGFEIEYGGIPQFGVAWPDRPPERFTEDWAIHSLITISEGAVPEPVAIDTSEVVSNEVVSQESTDEENPPAANVTADLPPNQPTLLPAAATTEVAPTTGPVVASAPVVSPVPPVAPEVAVSPAPSTVATVPESAPVATPTPAPAPVSEDGPITV